MKFWNLCAAAIFLTIQSAIAYQDRLALTLGPTLHYQFGKEKGILSTGIEVSFWVEQDPFEDRKHGNFLDKIMPCPYGIDIGIESNRNLLRLYTEPELGMLFFGVGVGPALEMDWKEHDFQFGAQGTLWAAAIVGLDARIQIMPGSSEILPGSFLKFPIPFYKPDFM
jgi:hypothetical protein